MKINVFDKIHLCDACLDGEGGECHTPGCALIYSRAPDIPIRQTLFDYGAKVVDQFEEFTDDLEQEIISALAEGET